jgi:hypothetical protein
MKLKSIITLAAAALLPLVGQASIKVGLLQGETGTGSIGNGQAYKGAIDSNSQFDVSDVAGSAWTTTSTLTNYDVLVITDCSVDLPSSGWGSVVNGNIVVIGSDIFLRSQTQAGAAKLIRNAIRYAYSANHVGAVVCMTDGTTVHGNNPIYGVTELENFSFTGVADDDVIVSTSHPLFAGTSSSTTGSAMESLSGSDLASWSHSIHYLLNTVPNGWISAAFDNASGSNNGKPFIATYSINEPGAYATAFGSTLDMEIHGGRKITRSSIPPIFQTGRCWVVGL